jgi:hypothetical protein
VAAVSTRQSCKKQNKLVRLKKNFMARSRSKLKERTLRIYNETPDTMRQANLSLGTEDGEIEEEESAVV